MAVVEFPIKDLESLVGRKLSTKELAEDIPMLGVPLEKMDSTSVHYEIFPNRPDMLGIEGFARSVRNFLGITCKIPAYSAKKGKIRLNVDSSVLKVRPFIAAAAVHNVRLTDELVASLMQVQEKMHDTVGRKRRKVAIGLHDLATVKPPFTYIACSPAKTSFVPLDMDREMSLAGICKSHPKGVSYCHIIESSSKWPVIKDANGNVLSFPPIINGELTRVTRKTKSLFIDVTGTGQKAVNSALNIIACALIDRGCTVESVEIAGPGRLHSTTPDFSRQEIKVSPSYVSRLLGVETDAKKLKALLMRMGIDFTVPDRAMVPCFRTDIMHAFDIAEDAAIAYGYMNFIPELPVNSTTSSRNDVDEFSAKVCEAMTGLGFQEIKGMILTNRENEFSKMNRKETDVCETSNPLSSECTICRKTLLPSILRTLFQNKNREYPHRIFESGFVIVPDKSSETGASSSVRLCCAISDTRASYENITPVIEAFLGAFGISCKLVAKKIPEFSSGRCAAITAGKDEIGSVGELNPAVLEKWNIEKPVCAFEIDIGSVCRLAAR